MRSDTAAVRGTLIAEGANLLAAAGVGAARAEAVRLWTEVSGDSPAQGILAPSDPVSADCADGYLAAVRRRARGEPFAHVTGWVGFRHLTLRSDRRALIPRPETEGLVELVLTRVPTGSVADVGSGTGCIALSLATEGRYDQVVGVDLSAEALQLADENRRLTGGQVSLVQGNLCAALAPDSLDALVSNPPYLTSVEHARLDPAVRDWEPALALVGGSDGLAVIDWLLDAGRRVVRPGGWLALEIDCARAAVCASRAGASGWSDVAIHADPFGRERYLLARRSDAGDLG